MTDPLRTQLRKIARLAREGVDGERTAAAETLARLLAKHGLTEADLDDQATSYHFFRVQGPDALQLFCQVACKVLGQHAVTYKRIRAGMIAAQMTRLQATEIHVLLSAVLPAWRRERQRTLKLAFQAFILRNDLHAPATPNDDREETPMSHEDLALLRELYHTSQRIQVRRQLPSAP